MKKKLIIILSCLGIVLIFVGMAIFAFPSNKNNNDSNDSETDENQDIELIEEKEILKYIDLWYGSYKSENNEELHFIILSKDSAYLDLGDEELYNIDEITPKEIKASQDGYEITIKKAKNGISLKSYNMSTKEEKEENYYKYEDDSLEGKYKSDFVTMYLSYLDTETINIFFIDVRDDFYLCQEFKKTGDNKYENDLQNISFIVDGKNINLSSSEYQFLNGTLKK